jgi:putative heme-binding domain-containing protein
LSNWSGLLPSVQDAIVEALFARQERLTDLLDAIQNGVVPAARLSALRQEQLVEHSNAAIRGRARTLFTEHSSDERAAVVKRYESALKLARDPKRGATLFEKHCSKCHKLDGKGFEIGPDLAPARTRPEATLLSDVLDPSRTLARGFTVYTLVTREGRVLTGLLGGESATSITLRREKGESDTILRKDVEELRASSKSLMPEGFEREVKPQDVADLIGYLRQPSR